MAHSQTFESRRAWLRRSSLAAIGLLAARASLLAETTSAPTPRHAAKQRRSLIILWLDGGPSQWETFDPHPGTPNGGPTKAIATASKGIQFASGLARVAEHAGSLAVVRSMVSKEGDHDRGRYRMKTGFRPNPTVVHPSLGAICSCQFADDEIEIPRFVSILGGGKFSRAGYLGESFDPLVLGDPQYPPANVLSPVSENREEQRLRGLAIVEEALARRAGRLQAQSVHREQVENALAFMRSPARKAFDLDVESARTRQDYGENPFGRGCLAARRLVEAGARCVEVELGGWDLHKDNFEGCAKLVPVLDQALAQLLFELRERDLLSSTLVLVAGEFGRTPRINGLDGRDHWTNGFSVALAGCGIRGGQVLGATDPAGVASPVDPVVVEDLFASMLTALGIDPSIEHTTSAGRPIKLSDGKKLAQLLGET
ncbi:MAG: DUF1501 domain-containing protein [Planctomycetota bacterium]